MDYDDFIEELCNKYDVEEVCDILGVSVKDILKAFPDRLKMFKELEDDNRGWIDD